MRRPLRQRSLSKSRWSNKLICQKPCRQRRMIPIGSFRRMIRKSPRTTIPRTPTVQADPSEQSAATEATAAPSVDSAPESPRSVAPAQGTGQSAQRLRVTWQKELLAHLNKFKRYPADRARQAAEVVVSFVLDRVGHVVSTRVVKGSGDASFDNAALTMLQRSDPVPPPPPLVADDGLTFTLPVIFQVKGRK